MKTKSKQLLKNLLIEHSYNLQVEDVALMTDIYCEIHNINKDKFIKDINTIRERLFNRTWNAETE
jgi:hypothetical protein